ncbi:unnamed protein product [Tilletia laevis]|nr:hypothetical protein CF336_g6632 [Tilletia laevis]KAE8200853.1 hypothetical protein CF328_g2846 [Tilletia controversa]CAD6887969.1 unnamed protein product [Tilletia caries]CAD6897523.1 unnamed protein product [Tilletia laevis]CAD6933495.1 unnamed protein product [Tilletia caries]
MKLLVCITLALSTAASSTALYAGNGSNLCQLFEHAGLINLDVLGCGRVLSRAPRHGDSKEKACSALRTAGLSNLDLIGCTIKDEQIVPPSARGWDGEDRHHMPPEQPEGSHPALKEPCDEPVHPPHSKQPSFPKYTPSDPPTTHTPPSTKQPPAKHLPVEGPGPVLKGPSDKPVQPPCSTKELCKVMQEGLINIEVLGCSRVGGGGHWHRGLLPTPAPHPKPSSPHNDDTKVCKREVCTILQKAGLVNVDILGCGRIF